MSKEFFDQYKHPKWQEKRLEALKSSDFSCQRCFDNESQLHVHHKRYIKGRKVWEYTNDELEVLCDSCHSIAHDELESLKAFMATFGSEAMNEFYWVLVGYTQTRSGAARSTQAVVNVPTYEKRFFEAGALAGMVADSQELAKKIHGVLSNA